MKKYSKLFAILLAVAMILPSFGQIALADEGVKVTRLAGDNAVATAIAVSQEAYEEADTVVIAGRVGSADALTGSLLAASKKAPLLIAGKGDDDNTAKVVAEIERLGAKNVIILGGEEAVAPAVAAKLEAIAGVTVKRVDGANRYETAAMLAEEADDTENVFLALGRAADNGALADALAIGPVSALKGMPVLLTRTDKLPAETIKALQDLKVKDVTIVGGEVAVSAAVKAELEALGLTVKRVAGSNRYDTSVEIAKEYFTNPENLLLANGKVDFDALVGGYFGAKLNAPILLTRDGKLADELKDYMADNKLNTYILGGTSVVAEAVVDEVVEILEGKEEEGELKVVSVSAINPTTILVEFNQDITEETAEVENYTLSKGTLEAVGVSGKIATLSIKGLKYGEEVTVKVVNPTYEKTVVIPEVSELYRLEVTTDADDDTIKSDGAAKMQVKVELKDKLTGETVKKDGVLQFQATKGGLGQTTSALQNGVAYVQLTSIASPVSVTSIITAVVSDVPGAAEFEGLSVQKTVYFTPDGQSETVEFVRPMYAESTQGDRFHVQFSGNIKAAEYKAAIKKLYPTTAIPAKEYGINVDGKAVAIKDIVNVTNDTLEFILEVDAKGGFDRIERNWNNANPNNYLRDNVEHIVTFPNKIGRVVLDDITGVKFILTDTSRPAVLGVTAKDQLEFTVRFTETVDRRTVVDKLGNFLIDGKGIYDVRASKNVTAGDILLAKQANKVILTDLSVGTYYFDEDAKPVDERNLITFVLHKDFALASGDHQIQIANVGDYAQDVDPAQNIIATDTFDFSVTPDNSIPEPTITVQSPEQWRVDFDKKVYGTTGKTVKDVFSLKSADSNDTFEMDTDYIVSSISKNGKTGNKLSATDSASILDGEQYFLIEFTKDWTVKYQTEANPLKTYFASTKNPYVVTIQNLESLVGNKMTKKDLNVNLSYDGVSPEIAEAEQATDLQGNLIQAVDVTMTEPVKNVRTNIEGLTPSQQQAKVDTSNPEKGVPVPTYEFVKGDKVVEGRATGFSYDDYRFTLTPEKTLESGTWTLYIRSISDDIGNTSATVSKELVIVEAEATATATQIAWAAFDDANGKSNSKLLFDTAKYDDRDVLYVKFTKVMKAGGANGVDRTQNYVFMGQPLPGATAANPEGSQVIRGIKGVTKDWDGVTIIMPKDTWNGTGTTTNPNDDFTVALNIASNFEAKDGEKLSGAYEIELKDTDTKVSNNTLDKGFEAVYKANIAATFDEKVAVKKATAKAATPINGKIGFVELETDIAVTIPATTEIYVNGKTFIYNSGAGTTNLKFKAKDEANQIAGTTTDKLIVTTENGAIMINTESVVDEVGPVITKAVQNGAGDELTITFSEDIVSANVPITAATFGIYNAETGTTAGTGTLTANKILSINGDTIVYEVGTLKFVNGDYINIANGADIKDQAGNVAAVTAKNVKVQVTGGSSGTTSTGVTATSATSTAGKAAVKAEYSFTVTNAATTAGDITFTNVASANVNVTLAITDNEAAVAGKIETELNGATGSLYDVTIAGAKVTLTAKTGGAITTDPTFVAGSTGANIDAITEDVAGVDENLGTVVFTIVTGANKSGTITVTVTPSTGIAVTKTVNVTAGMSANDVAAAIQAAGVTGFTATVSANQVTLTETVGSGSANTYTVSVQ